MKDIFSLFKTSTFPAGENYVNLTQELNLLSDDVTLFFRYQGDSSLFKLALAADAIKRAGFSLPRLFIPYFPGARQDRVCLPGDSLSVKVYADFINNLGFKSITIYDPHSDVTPALINNVRVEDNFYFISKVISFIEQSKVYNYLADEIVFVSPDAGANKKISNLSYILGHDFIRADKKRDLETGNISNVEVYMDESCPEDKHYLIIDDIISGGRTFMNLAEKLKEKGCKHIYLAVSHHEGHANNDLLKKSGIERVFTTNSIYTKEEDDFTKVIPILSTTTP